MYENLGLILRDIEMAVSIHMDGYSALWKSVQDLCQSRI